MKDPTQQPGIRIEQILLERSSFEHVTAYLDHPPATQINIQDVDVEIEGGLSAEGDHGLVRMRVRTGDKGGPSAFYRFDVTVVALLGVDKSNPNMELPEYFGTSGAALLYPFVREIVANITGRGRFGPIWLIPLNLTQTKFGQTRRVEAVTEPPRARAGS